MRNSPPPRAARSTHWRRAKRPPTLRALRDQVSAGRDQAIAQLRRWIGAAAELPLGGDVPAWPIDADQLSHTLHQHPELLRFASEQRVLDADDRPGRAPTGNRTGT